MHLLSKDLNIDVRLNVDYFKVKDRLPKHKLLIFTGPIDAFYVDQGWQKLEYRSIFFEVKLEFILGVGSSFVQRKKILEKGDKKGLFALKKRVHRISCSPFYRQSYPTSILLEEGKKHIPFLAQLARPTT